LRNSRSKLRSGVCTHISFRNTWLEADPYISGTKGRGFLETPLSGRVIAGFDTGNKTIEISK
jgi:hypothetical protein